MRKHFTGLRFLISESWKALNKTIRAIWLAIYLNPIKLLLIIAAAISILSTAVAFQFFFNQKRAFLAQIVAESFGMVLDIVVLGVLMIWINKVNERRKKIDSAVMEIDDLRVWTTDRQPDILLSGSGDRENYEQNAAEIALTKWKNNYSALKIARHIKTLNTEGITSINLNHCHLPFSNLGDKNLMRSNLDMSNFSGSLLSYINLSHTSACGARFKDCDLRGANLQKIIANGAEFSDSIMIGANLSSGLFVNASFVNARLNEAKFINADLRAADFSGSYLVGVDFTGSTGITAKQLIKARFMLRCLLPERIENELTNLRKSKDSVINAPPQPQFPSQKLAG